MNLFLGLIFGAIGTGYLVYAKKEYSAAFALAGAALILYSYVFTSALAIVVFGALLAAAPFAWNRWSDS